MVEAKIRFQRLLRPRGKDAFVRALPLRSRVFDIGCGNNSPERVKALRSDLYYVGIDVQDYAQTGRSVGMANEYRITTPETFLDALAIEKGTMDAVISSHNLEHCEDPMAVVHHMVGALKPGGRLYLSFPCEASDAFPSRRGSLRFSDDPTHRTPPPWSQVLRQLETRGMTTQFSASRYRPWLPAALGALLEPLSMLNRRVMPFGSTWALWGFESVIWAVKTPTSH